MNEPDFPKPWPPREGWKFFRLWVAGLLVFLVIFRVGVVVVDQNVSLFLPARGPFVIIAVGLHLWQAWLLFSGSLHRLLWVSLPLLSMLLFPLREDARLYLIASPTGFSLHLADVVMPVLEMALLIGVRRQLLTWLTARLVQWFVGTLGREFLVSFWMDEGGQMQTIRDNFIVATGSTSTLLGHLLVLQESALWFVSEIVVAIALAFWMPPVACERGTSSPPPRTDSTSE